MSGISPPVARSFSGHQSPVFGGGESLLSPVPPLDATTVDYWDADRLSSVSLVGGAFVDTWTGLLAGTVLTAPTSGRRPNYVADSALRGTNVVQSTVTGTRCLANTSAGTLAANASRPYTISAFRLHVVPGASVVFGILGLGVNASQDHHYVHYQTFGGSQLRPIYNNGAVNVQATATADTLNHVVEFWPDGTNLNCRDNGTLFTTASNTSLGAGCTSIAIGRAASVDNSFANCNHAFHMLCSAKPSESYIANLKSWLAVKKGTLA